MGFFSEATTDQYSELTTTAEKYTSPAPQIRAALADDYLSQREFHCIRAAREKAKRARYRDDARKAVAPPTMDSKSAD